MNVCHICQKEYESNVNFGLHIKKGHKITSEEYFLKYLNTSNQTGTCKICNKRCKFKSLEEGYRTYCSLKCMNLDPDKYEKIKKTNLEKYGSISPFGNIDIKNKANNTILNKYGVENVFQSKEIKNKIKDTSIKKYGVEHHLKNKNILEKQYNSNIEKYGVKNQFQRPDILNKIYKMQLKTFYDELVNGNRLNDKCIPMFSFDEYTGSKNEKYKWKCNKCNNIFYDYVHNGIIPRCSTCVPFSKSSSYGEKEILNFCKLYFDDIMSNTRNIIDNYELDIYIPEIKLAIEFNGLYWHSEDYIDKNYHLNKYLECKKLGIKLIQIFEDEWYYTKEIIESILINNFGKVENKFSARSCTIKDVNINETNNFLNNNHIQGKVKSYYKSIGLYNSNDELISILLIGKSRFNKNYEYEILRFCNKLNTNVRGGLSKLITHFIKNNNPKSIITYSDLRFGEGKSYLNCGFKFSELSLPGYFYTKGKIKYNRIKFQKHKLSKLLENFDSNLTEKENMKNNGYNIVWDCGNNIYTWNEE